MPVYYTVGNVLQSNPLRIRADGMDLDSDDLMINAMLGYDYTEVVEATYVENGKKVTLEVQQSVSCYASCANGAHTSISLHDLPGALSGTVMMEMKSRRLAAGDQVLMIPDREQQTYFVVCKVVHPDVFVSSN